MLARKVWLAATAMASLFAQSVNAKAEVAPPGQILVIASPSFLPQGASCRILMHPEEPEKSPTPFTVFTIFEGTIKETTKGTVVLTGATFETHSTNNSVLGKLPFLSRYFKNTGTARTPVKEKELRIPVDEIRSITLIEEAHSKAADRTNAPPVQTRP